MSKVRINDLAREMEVKSGRFLTFWRNSAWATARRTPVHWRGTRPRRFARNLSVARAVGHAGAGSFTLRLQTITAEDRSLAHLQARRCAEGDSGQEKRGRGRGRGIRMRCQAGGRDRGQKLLAKPRRRWLATPAPAAPAPPAPPEPRKIVPQPRSAPQIIQHRRLRPSLRSRRRASCRQGSRRRSYARPVVVVAPPPGTVVVKPPVAPAKEAKPRAAEKPAAKAPMAPPRLLHQHQLLRQHPHLQLRCRLKPPVVVAPAAPAARSSPAASAEAPAARGTQSPAPTPHPAPAPTPKPKPAAPPAPPARRMVMPQTGPRPVYKAPILPPVRAPAGTCAAGAGIQRGKPIFDRRPSGAPGGFQQRSGPAAPGRASSPAVRDPSIRRAPPMGLADLAVLAAPAARPGFGARPGFRRPPRPGGLAATTRRRRCCTDQAEAPRPQRAPSARPSRGRPAVSQDQRRPDEGLCAAATLWRRCNTAMSRCRSRARSP